MRILFAGGADISVPSLSKLADEQEIAAVLTHPDTTSGRGRRKTVNPVKIEAQRLGLPIVEAPSLGMEVENRITDLAPDLLVVVAYGKIFSRRFLELFPRGGVNLHPSLLPKYRGPSPATAAIVNGDDTTGITIQRVEYKMDAGDILLQEEVRLNGSETTGSLLEAVAGPGAELLCKAIREWESGKIQPKPQNESEATYCRLIKKEDGHIDWAQSAAEIERMVRAYSPWPGTFTDFQGSKLMIWEAVPLSEQDTGGTEVLKRGELSGKVAGIDKKEGILIQTGNGLLAVKKLQLQAKKALDWKSFINGNRQFLGSRLS